MSMRENSERGSPRSLCILFLVEEKALLAARVKNSGVINARLYYVSLSSSYLSRTA